MAKVYDVGITPPRSFAGGTKPVTVPATPEKLVATSTPCRFVWIGARCSSAGAVQNASPAFVGDSASQNMPIMPSNFEGFTIAIDDASKIYVKVGTALDAVNYRIFV